MTTGCHETCQRRRRSRGRGRATSLWLPITVSLLQCWGCREPGEVGTSPVLSAPGAHPRGDPLQAGQDGQRSSTAAPSADRSGNGTAGQGGGTRGWPCLPGLSRLWQGWKQRLHPDVSPGAGTVLPRPCLRHQAVGQRGVGCSTHGYPFSRDPSRAGGVGWGIWA